MRRALVLVLVITMTGRAGAQANDASPTAEQLFEQGRVLAGEARWTEACPKFEASLRADPALGTRLNLATCYEHVGKLARAWALYRESIDLAERAHDDKRHAYAREHAAALEPRLARLVINAPSPAPAELLVTWDGNRVEPGALGVGLFADAGTHELRAWVPGAEVFTKTIALIAGAQASIAIPVMAPQAGSMAEATAPPPAAADVVAELAVAPPPPVAMPVAPVVPGRAVTPSSSRRTYLALGIGAAGLAATGVGLGFGVKARSLFNDTKELCGAGLTCSADHFDQGRRLDHNAHTDARYATVLVGAGVAAIAAAAIVFVTRPRSPEPEAARVIPVTHDHGAGLAVVGKF